MCHKLTSMSTICSTCTTRRLEASPQLRPLSPWFDAECRAVRRNCCCCECRYRRTRDARRHKHEFFDQTNKLYWSQRINADGNSRTKLWHSLTALLQRDHRSADDISPTCNDADNFLQFFDQKVKTVRAATEGRPLSPSTTVTVNVSLSMLSPCSEDEVRRLILQSPTKSCDPDPIPTFLLKELVDVLLPHVTAMINATLCAGRLPPPQKHAVVTPLLKKTGLDAEEWKNYRPVSNLTFLSKMVERVIASRLTTYLSGHSLMPHLQSAY